MIKANNTFIFLAILCFLQSQSCTVSACSSCASDISICDQCSSGYYLLSNACYSCPYPCSGCTSSSYCNACSYSYYYLNSGSCIQCDNGCCACTSTGPFCSQCFSGHILIANICQRTFII